MNINTSTISFLCLAVTLNFCVCNLFGQANEFPSKAKEKYYAGFKFKPFTPAPVYRVKKTQYEHINLIRFQKTDNPFTSVWERSVHQKISDSIFYYANQLASQHRDDPKMFTKVWINTMNTIDSLDRYKTIGGIDIGRILRIDTLKEKKAIIYLDSKYEGYLVFGYWLALSNNRGNDWQYYYLGLTENQHIHFKPDPAIPLFYDDHTLQIECDLVRQTSQRTLPVGDPEYELIEDDIIAKIDLQKVIIDSDKDGLTDIEEKRLLLLVDNPDSDGDGIQDALDSNPLNASEINKYTILYKYLIEPPFNWRDSIIPFEPVKFVYSDHGFDQQDSILYTDPDTRDFAFEADSIYKAGSVNIIVTNDENLKHLPSTIQRYLIIGENDYKYLEDSDFIPIEEFSITPLFPVDDMPDHYVISISGPFWSNEYLVIEKEDHWIVRIIGMMIV